MSNETIKIYLWPDNSWESEEEIDDMDFYLMSSGKSDDYAEYEVDINLDAEDITELIELQALPGMMPNKAELDLYEMGEIELKEKTVIIIDCPNAKDGSVTILENKVIINSDKLKIKFVKEKE